MVHGAFPTEKFGGFPTKSFGSGCLKSFDLFSPETLHQINIKSKGLAHILYIKDWPNVCELAGYYLRVMLRTLITLCMCLCLLLLRAYADRYRGGLGLTGGISDVGGLVDCLYGIYDGKASLDILDEYDRIRREVYKTITDPTSTRNLERIWKDPETLRGGKDPFFAKLDRLKEDPNALDEMEKVNLPLSRAYCACSANRRRLT